MVSNFFILVLTLAFIGEVLLVQRCGFDPKSTIAYKPVTHTQKDEQGTLDFPLNFPRKSERNMLRE